MENLTLVIPAKNEKESLPKVFDELKNYKLKKIVVLEKADTETINSISNYHCDVIYQRNNGYGAALIEGINKVETKYFCIFNADGSFNPRELNTMQSSLIDNQSDFIFASRYEEGCKSDDDTIITLIGNYIFTKIGKIFFGLNITDILYTFVLGKTEEFKNLDIQSKDFGFCVELPIKAKRLKKKTITSKSHERSRIGGKKKVNALKDGFLILTHMINLFFNKN